MPATPKTRGAGPKSIPTGPVAQTKDNNITVTVSEAGLA